MIYSIEISSDWNEIHNYIKLQEKNMIEMK